MKRITILKIALLAVPFLLSSCWTKKQVVKEPVVTTNSTQRNFLEKVSDNAQNVNTITSKVKFQIQVGPQDMSLTGNLRMKRNDVIQMQLMAFGFVEAARLEFTPDYVLCMDRINKQYIKASYDELSFLKESGLNFYSLQALFWNELFQPGQTKVTDVLLRNYNTSTDGNNVIITLTKGLMSYKWLANSSDSRINMANIVYDNKDLIDSLSVSKKKKDKEEAKEMKRNKTELTWDYEDFQNAGTSYFPYKNTIEFRTGKKDVKMTIILNYVQHETEWNTRTEVSSKYKKVSVDDILRRFMAL